MNKCPFCSLPPEINGRKESIMHDVFQDIDHLVLFYVNHFPHYWELDIASNIKFEHSGAQHNLRLYIPMHYCLYCGRKLDE